MSSIFGGSSSSSNGRQESTSQSNNQAYPQLDQQLSPQIQQGTSATSQIGNLLGLNGQQGQNQAFKNWQGSTGYQFGLDQGAQSITGNAATQGLLNSGATAKALQTYGTNYANTQYQNYLNPLQNLVSSGNQAAGVVAQAGQQSQSQSQGTTNQSSNSKNNPFTSIFGIGGI